MAFMDQFRRASQPQQAPQPSIKSQLSQLRSLMQGDTSAAVSNLAQSNPQFAQFLQQNSGKSIEEAFKAYGYDLSEVLGLINS